MQKKSYKLLYLLCSLSFMVFVLLAVVDFWSFNEDFYRSEHQKLKLYGKSISEHIGITDEDLDELTGFTLDYLNRWDTSLDKKIIIKGQLREVFNDDEKLHMVDVRKLNILSVYLGFAALIAFNVTMYLIINKRLFKQFYQFNKIFYRNIAIVFLLLGTWIVIDFNSFWNFFHHIFFAGNDLWLLDLNKDVLIMIVPPEFFFHLVTVILVSFVVILILYNLVLFYINKEVNKHDQYRII